MIVDNVILTCAKCKMWVWTTARWSHNKTGVEQMGVEINLRMVEDGMQDTLIQPQMGR